MIFWALRHVAALIAIGVVAVALHGRGFAPADGGDAGREPMGRFAPATRNAGPSRDAAASRTMVFRAGRDGHFTLRARVDGARVRFLVDTGASAVVLNRRDAERIGLHLRERNFTKVFQTANGPVRAAPVVLRSVKIGALNVRNVEAYVNEGAMGVSLLGMSFLRQLDGYEVSNDKLTLSW